MSHLNQQVLHKPTSTFHFSAPMQWCREMYSRRPSRFREVLKKIITALQVSKILSVSGSLHDAASDKFKL